MIKQRRLHFQMSLPTKVMKFSSMTRWRLLNLTIETHQQKFNILKMKDKTDKEKGGSDLSEPGFYWTSQVWAFWNV